MAEFVLEIIGGWFLSGASGTLMDRNKSTGVKLAHLIVLNILYLFFSALFVFLLLKFQESGLRVLFGVLLLGDVFLVVRIWYLAIRYIRL